MQPVGSPVEPGSTDSHGPAAAGVTASHQPMLGQSPQQSADAAQQSSASDARSNMSEQKQQLLQRLKGSSSPMGAGPTHGTAAGTVDTLHTPDKQPDHAATPAHGTLAAPLASEAAASAGAGGAAGKVTAAAAATPSSSAAPAQSDSAAAIASSSAVATTAVAASSVVAGSVQDDLTTQDVEAERVLRQLYGSPDAGDDDELSFDAPSGDLEDVDDVDDGDLSWDAGGQTSNEHAAAAAASGSETSGEWWWNEFATSNSCYFPHTHMEVYFRSCSLVNNCSWRPFDNSKQHPD